ncbi:unnamed protein product, partial [marine sediment metagenome]
FSVNLLILSSISLLILFVIKKYFEIYSMVKFITIIRIDYEILRIPSLSSRACSNGCSE